MKTFFNLITIMIVLFVLGIFIGFDGFLGTLLLVVFTVVLFYAAFWLLIFGGLVAIANWILGQNNDQQP